jgi:hypothetical protein
MRMARMSMGFNVGVDGDVMVGERVGNGVGLAVALGGGVAVKGYVGSTVSFPAPIPSIGLNECITSPVEEEMGGKKAFNRNLARAAWGSLLIWWGVVLIVNPLTMGIGAMGTGVILLGLNAFRWLKGYPTRGGTTQFGLMVILWGLLDQARYMLALPSGFSLALLLIVGGFSVLITPLFTRPKFRHVERTGDV